ncbi:MAG: hypothetical protein V4622_00485 [Bacteroidota bacterium]
MEKMKIYLILFFVGFYKLNYFSQNNTPITFPKGDTIVMEDYGLILPKWKVDFNPHINSGSSGGYLGLGAEFSYHINDAFSSKINLNENYNVYYGIGGDFLTTNYSFDFYYLLFYKNKIKPAFFLKKFYNKTTNSFFKPTVAIKKKKQIKIGLGLTNKCVRDEMVRFDHYYREEKAHYIGNSLFVTSGPIDYVFDEDDLEFDYDGFINELQSIKYFNQYSLKLTLNYSINKDYKFSIQDRVIKKKSLNEYYCSMLIGISQNAKYDDKNQNFDIKNNFVGRVDYKRFGWAFGVKHTLKFININYEIGVLPNYIFTSDFYQEAINYNSYMFENIMKDNRWFYTQFSIGYTFGQKIKPSK